MQGWIKFGTKIDTKTFDKQIEELEDKIEDLENQKILFTADEDTANLQAVNVELEKAKNKLIGLQKQQEQLNVSSQKSFKGINNGMEGVLRKVSKWALAIFGIRSAYMLVRRSVSQLSQYDENLANQLQYISWTIAQAIAPVVRWIVNAVYLILQYVNQITSSLFGFKLFKGPDEFAKSMKSASGSAKEIQKSLAGFDEMNILGGNTRQAGGGGATMPEFDTESVLNSIDKFTNGMKKLGKNFRKEIEDMYDALDNPQAFTDAYGKWDMLVYGITELFAGLGQSIIGVFDAIGGWSKIITGLINGDWEQMTEGVKQVWKGTFEFLKGIWTMIVGAFDTIIGGIKGIVLSIYDYIKEKFQLLSLKLTTIFNALKGALVKPFNALKTVAEEVLNWISEKLGPIIDKVGGLKENLSNIIKEGKSSVSAGVSTQISTGLGNLIGSTLRKKLGLAKGTILNNPGQGVPLSNVVAGEQGREALIPLSDSQLLEELGSTIGRYVSINLTNITELDGSTIARKVSKINQENNFATNR